MVRSYRRGRYSRGNRRYIRTSRGGRTKRMVDGHLGPYIRAGLNAMPYVLRTISTLKSLINTEPKYIDVSSAVNPSSAAMVYTRLTPIAQGTTDITRIGNKILLKDIVLRMRVTINGAASATSVRVILFCFKTCNGSDPGVNILAGASTEAPLNLDFSKDIVVIRDFSIPLSINGTRDQHRKSYNILNFHCDFDGTSSNIGDAKQNQIYLGYLSNEPTNTPSLAFYSRVKYYDS